MHYGKAEMREMQLADSSVIESYLRPILLPLILRLQIERRKTIFFSPPFIVAHSYSGPNCGLGLELKLG